MSPCGWYLITNSNMSHVAWSDGHSNLVSDIVKDQIANPDCLLDYRILCSWDN